MISIQTKLLGRKVFDHRVYFFLAAIVLLFVFDAIAIYNSWYFYYAWVDIPVHIAAGLILSVLFYYIVFTNNVTGIFFKIKRSRETVFSVMTFWVLTTAIVWEIAEFVWGRTVVSPKLIPDTFLDIIMTITGALIGYWLIKIIKKL